MGKNGTYHKNQLVELYNLVYIPFKTETQTWECSLVSVRIYAKKTKPPDETCKQRRN